MLISIHKLNTDVTVNSWGNSLNSPRRLSGNKNTLKHIRNTIKNNGIVIIYNCPKTKDSVRPTLRVVKMYPSGALYTRKIESIFNEQNTYILTNINI